MAYGKRLLFEPQRELAFGGISANYAAIGTAMTHPIRILMVDNLTNGNLQFTTNGVTDHFVVAAGSSKVLDISTNRATNESFFLSSGDTISVKQITAPTTGNVYVSVIHGKGD